MVSLTPVTPMALAAQAELDTVVVHAVNAGEPLLKLMTEVASLAKGADPSPVVELNRAAAAAMRDGPGAGLMLIDGILERGELADYALAHSARAELCRRLGRTDEAIEFYQRALELTSQGPQRRFLERRLAESNSSLPSPSQGIRDTLA